MRCSTINRDFIMRRVYFRTLRFAQNVFLNFDPRVDDTKVVLWQIDFFPAQSQGRFVIKRITVGGSGVNWGRKNNFCSIWAKEKKYVSLGISNVCMLYTSGVKYF
jgi:hypothetical protein